MYTVHSRYKLKKNVKSKIVAVDFYVSNEVSGEQGTFLRLKFPMKTIKSFALSVYARTETVCW